MFRLFSVVIFLALFYLFFTILCHCICISGLCFHALSFSMWFFPFFAGDPNELVSTASPLNGWESNNFLVPLSLVYDVTPPDLVTAVVTELAILPCTSVPVVLRIKPTESSA